MKRTVSRRQPGGPRPKPNLELLRARMEKCLSREALGDLAGISGKQVGMLETGKARYPRMSTVEGLASALERRPSELFRPEQIIARGK